MVRSKQQLDGQDSREIYLDWPGLRGSSKKFVESVRVTEIIAVA